MPAEACAVFSLTNVERMKLNLPTLEANQTCAAMAQEQSDDMAARGYFDHNRPAAADRPAETYRQRAQRWGLRQGFGENIAMTGAGPARVLEMWMNSPGHRRNILNPRFRYLGVGVNGRLYTQSFSN